MTMAACSPATSINPAQSSFHCSFPTSLFLSPFTISFSFNPKTTSLSYNNPRHHTISVAISSPTNPTTLVSAPDKPRIGSDILVEALEREGVSDVFSYVGDHISVEIRQALTCSKVIRNVLAMNSEGGVFMAKGYAQASGKPGVCITTTMSEAAQLVTGFADALLDSVPMVGIVGFKRLPVHKRYTVDTKHTYTVLNVKHIPRVVKEAFYLATTGRPDPVLIDIPRDILWKMSIPDWDQPMKLGDKHFRLPTPSEVLLEKIVRLISEAKRPVVYVGGGCLNSSEELKKFVELMGIPVASTLMGLGCYPCSDELSLKMLGMDRTGFANYAVDKSDLMLAFGVKFDDHVTGKLEAGAKIVHVDVDPAEIGKNKQPHVSICGDVKLALAGLNSILEEREGNLKFNFSSWREELNEQKRKHALTSKTFGDAIVQQYAIQTLDELTKGNAIITTGVGQHQMYAAQFYKYNRPRQWLTSGGLGAVGFGLPAAIGAVVARPDAIVVDIEDDKSFMVNKQELRIVRAENLPVKIMLLNESIHEESHIFPMLVAEHYNIPAARVSNIYDLRPAIQKMLDTPGPYLLNVIVPHQEHVLQKRLDTPGPHLLNVIDPDQEHVPQKTLDTPEPYLLNVIPEHQELVPARRL